MTFAATAPSSEDSATWVRPTDELVAERPELAGDVGKVISTESESMVVQWNGQRKPYRVSPDLIAPTEG